MSVFVFATLVNATHPLGPQFESQQTLRASNERKCPATITVIYHYNAISTAYKVFLNALGVFGCRNRSASAVKVYIQAHQYPCHGLIFSKEQPTVTAPN